MDMFSLGSDCKRYILQLNTVTRTRFERGQDTFNSIQSIADAWSGLETHQVNKV